MKKAFLTCFVVFFFSIAKSQDLVEEISNSICNCVEKNRTLKDTALMNYCFINAMEEVKNVPKKQKKLEELFSKAHFYLQKNCKKYIDLQNEIAPQNGDWVQLDSNLTSTLDSEQCRQIINYDKLYYLEHTGDTTRLSLKDGVWLESFKDGKYYSKCNFRWISNTDFEIEFIKSDDPVRSKLSKKGDKYVYRVVSKTDKYFLLTAHYGRIWQQFKIYYL